MVRTENWVRPRMMLSLFLFILRMDEKMEEVTTENDYDICG